MPKNNKLKTLFLDIETSPNVVYSWRVGNKININHDNIIKERAIICICWKWAGVKKVHSLTWDKKQCDRSMLEEFSENLRTADQIVTQNGDRFDIKWINARLAYHNLDPVGDLTSRDTLKMSRRVFYLNSFKLDYMGQFFKVGEKVKTGGFQLWKDICEGGKVADRSMKKMIRYCQQDVRLLEKIFNRIVKYNPSLGSGWVMDHDREACKNCGDKRILRWGKYISVTGYEYQKYKCKKCGAVFRDSKKIK